MNPEELEREVLRETVKAKCKGFDEKLRLLLDCSTLLNSAAFNRDNGRIEKIQWLAIKAFVDQIMDAVLT